MKISQKLRDLLTKELPANLDAKYPFLIIPFATNKGAEKAAEMIEKTLFFEITVIGGEDEY